MTKKIALAPRLTVEVTHEIISQSVQRDSSHCMIADAVRAAFPTATHVSVDLQTIRFSDPDKNLRYTYLTPRSGQIGLVEFDQGIAPVPMRFQLRNGQVTRRNSGRSGAAKSRERGTETPRPDLASARLTSRSGTSTHGETIPARIGGRTPPTTPFARRRAFGLRALER